MDYFKIKGGKPFKREKKERNGSFKDIDFKKSLGQNFLSDINLLNSIVKCADVNQEDCVLEIGAGAGTLTNALANNAKKVISYEIDRSLKDRLDIIQNQHKNLEIVFKDFMEVDVNEIYKKEKTYKVVANIPYYITTPIIFKLLEVCNKISCMLFMVQKEVAERFASKEGNKMYGKSSVVLQAIADVSYEKTVKKECFTPMPKVDSALIKISFNKQKLDIKNYEKFKELVHSAFSMRRKTLVNNLTKNLNISKENLLQCLNDLGLEVNVRPEDISVENYVKLANKLL